MKNEELKIRFDQALRPLNYKKKGNKWTTKTEDLTKIIELQKSGYSNLYYINYCINFNHLDYTEVRTHVFNRHNNRLNLETANDNVLNRLADEALDQITEKFNQLTTVEDVLAYIETLPTLNILPLRVKEFLNLK